MAETHKICDCLKMDLVKIEREAENIFIQTIALSKTGIQTKDGNQYWIGASNYICLSKTLSRIQVIRFEV